jgi:hypothetical protein
MGCVLIVFGMGLVVVQIKSRPMSGRPRGLSFDMQGIRLQTTYPGIILIGIGAVLLLVGATTSS